MERKFSQPLYEDFFDASKEMREISDWIDNYEPNKERSPEAQLWGRVAKVYEEKEEVISALVGYTNQNPRKGQTHTLEDVRKELLDVALTALAAVEHIDGNDGLSLTALLQHIHYVHTRAGL